MSRGQEGTAFDTAKDQNAGYYKNAQTSYNNAQQDITNYQDQLSKFAASNPYKQGGEYQTQQNKSIANTADAAAQAAGQAVQSQAVRTGQNTGGAIAATEAMQEQNERSVADQEATANTQRIGNEAGYNKETLAASAVPAQLESSLYGTSSGAANSALGEEVKSGETPSFLDTLGSSFAQSLGSGVGSWMSGKLPSCWIAAELYGGWDDPRTIVFRAWLHGEFRLHWYGVLPVAAYRRWGKQMAAYIHMPEHSFARALFQRIFDAGLRRAKRWAVSELDRLELAAEVL